MTKKKWALLIAVVALIPLVFIFAKGTIILFEETTLIEEAKSSTYFEEDEPYIAESLISGRLTFRDQGQKVDVILSEAKAQDIINELATTEIRRTLKQIKNDNAEQYVIALDNDGYQMSYDLHINYLLSKNKETNEFLIRANFSEWNYIVEDASLYNKLEGILRKASSN